MRFLLFFFLGSLVNLTQKALVETVWLAGWLQGLGATHFISLCSLQQWHNSVQEVNFLCFIPILLFLFYLPKLDLTQPVRKPDKPFWLTQGKNRFAYRWHGKRLVASARSSMKCKLSHLLHLEFSLCVVCACAVPTACRRPQRVCPHCTWTTKVIAKRNLRKNHLVLTHLFLA